MNIRPTSGPADAHCERRNRRTIRLQQNTTRSLFVTRLRIRMREGPGVWLNSRFQIKLLRHVHASTATAAPRIRIASSFSLPVLLPPMWQFSHVYLWLDDKAVNASVWISCYLDYYPSALMAA